MSLPEDTETQEVTTEKWRVERIEVARRGDGIAVRVFDRRVRNGVPTDEYRTRELADTEAVSLWASTASKTYKSWLLDIINPNAE